MNRKKNIMSLSGFNPILQDELKKYAKIKDISVSKLVKDTLERYLFVEDEVVILNGFSVETQARLKKCAENKNVSVSKLVKDVLEKYLFIEEDVMPVFLRIPVALKGDKENLQKWLQVRVDGIVNALTS